jgi:hypothetical protein
VTASSLSAAIEIMRARLAALDLTQSSIRIVGVDEIEAVLPDVGNAAPAQEELGKTGQLYFYDWEPNVIGRSGNPVPNEGIATGDTTTTGPGGVTAGLLEYQAVLRAARRPAILRKTDTTWGLGCTPRQEHGCLYGSWYLLDAAREAVLRGPVDTSQDLYADRHAPPAAARPRAVRVNPGTVLVQAHPVEDENTGRVINPSPNGWYVLNDDPALSGADIMNPAQSNDEVTGQPNVTFGFTPYGKVAFERLTREVAHRGQEAQVPGVSKEAAQQHFAIVLDGQLISVPSIDYARYPEGIDASNGSEISGGLTIASARSLANELQSGPLPVKLELISRSLVKRGAPGASLADLTTAVPRTQRSSWSFGPLAGYLWRGRVQMVSASWTVPRVIPGSPAGVAGTWVGTRAPGPSSRAPFIQIGVNEQALTPTAKRPTDAIYDAFWSATSRHFHPQFLFPVHAGDTVAARLALTHERWTLAIVDTTSGAAAHFSTSAEAHAPFNAAMWMQEDVTNQTTGKPFAYPRLTPTDFSQLTVNSAPPTYADLDSQWMSAGDSSLAPSPLHRDSFTLRQAAVSSAGAQYLRIADPEDAATEAFAAQMAGWRPRTPRRQIASASRGFQAALRTNVATLTHSPWPTRVHGLVASLIVAIGLVNADLEAVTSIPSAGLASWISRIERDAAGISDAGHKIRRALGLPEL